MKRSPLDLAAVATAAVPGLRAAEVGWLPDDREDFDSALVIDAAGGRWRVRSPKHTDASLRLETELRALGGLSPAARGAFPFAVPSVAGTVRRGELKTFVYHHLDGRVLQLSDLSAPGSDFPSQIGRAIAAIHASDRDSVERAGLPSEEAEEYRRARLSELDQVAASGKVPAALLRRWEAAMEDVSLWRFNACVVHGDFHEEQVYVHDGRVVAVTGWSDLHVGDPAEDLAWLLAVDDQRVIDAVVEAYSSWRGDKADPHLMTRATLAAEFALARWLARALTRGDAQRIAEAEALLAELDDNLRDLGDKPIGLVEAAPAAPEAASPAPVTAAVTELSLPDGAAAVAPERGAEGVVEKAPSASSPSSPVSPKPAPDVAPSEERDGAPAAAPKAESETNKETDPAANATAEDEAAPASGATAGTESRDEDGSASGAEDSSAADSDAEPAQELPSAEKASPATAAQADAKTGPEASEAAEAEPSDTADEEPDDEAVITDADVSEPATEAISTVPPAKKDS